MKVFPNGHTYKLVYLDTNVLNYIAKNTYNVAKNFLLEYCETGEYMFVTSAFNMYELFNSKYESRKRIIKFFNTFPLAIMATYPQLVENEKISKQFTDDMVLFAIGPKGFFNVQIETLINYYDKGVFSNAISVMTNNFEKELAYWNDIERNPKWMHDFENSMLIKMNELFSFSQNAFHVKKLGEYKSLEIYTFIAFQFIHSKSGKKRKNSIIDAYNSSLLPYVEVYITENTVGSWLEMAKDKFSYLKKKKIVKVRSLFES